MALHDIPGDLKAEELLNHLAAGTTRVIFRGRHARNAYGDILGVEQLPEGRLQVDLARNSIYHDLPEYVFHPIDRFDNLPRLEEKERFEEELEKQEQEKENARRFFEPLDLMLLQVKMEARRKLSEWTDTNKVLIDILADRLTKEQNANPLISHAINFLPACRNIRGDKMLLTLMIRKIFNDEGLHLDEKMAETTFQDDLPTRYAINEGSELGDCFVGNLYNEEVHGYTIHYWDDEKCDEHFLQFVEQVEGFRIFIEDYFLAIGDQLRFDIVTDAAPPCLNDNKVYNHLDGNTYNYLDYNTNL